MNDDAALLHRYAAARSQDAFAALVQRHLGLVYHAALRSSGYDPHRAEDITQLVFTEVARQAATLAQHPLFAAWLHTCTRQIAAKRHREETRRRAREHAAFEMNADDASPAEDTAAADWERLRPFIDDALDSLAERDRAAVLLRFFENRPYAEVASALSVTEDAARVRVNRALEKLRSALARRGLVSTASALGLALAQPALASTPAGLAASITTASLSGAVATGTAAALATTATMSTAKIASLTAGTLAALSVGIAVYSRTAPATHAVSQPPAPALSSANLSALLHPARLSPPDADAALAAYLALPSLPSDTPRADYLERASRLRALLAVLPADHLARLLDATITRPGPHEARLREITFSTWAELDAPAAAKWALAAPFTDDGSEAKIRATYLKNALGSWSDRDFDAAYAWINTLADPTLAGDLAQHLLASRIPTDPARALALARARGDEFFTAASEALCTAWSKKDPAAAARTFAVDLYTQTSPSQVHGRYFPTTPAQITARDAIARWLKKAPSDTLDWILSLRETNEAVYQDLMPSIITRVVSNDPEYALPLLDQLARRPDLPGRQNTVALMVRDWSTREPRAALEWLKQQPPGEERAEMVSAVIEMMGSNPSPYFSNALDLLPEGPARNRCITTCAQYLAYSDPAAALVWLKENAPPELVAALTHELQKATVAHLAKTDLAAATRWLDNEIATRPPGLDRDDLLASTQTITSRLARKDPEALLRWAEKNPDPAIRQKAYQALSMDRDMETFGGSDLNPISHRHRADLLATVSDPQAVAAPLTTLLSNWLERDYEAARAWIETHEAISPETAAKLLTEKAPDRYEVTLGYRQDP